MNLVSSKISGSNVGNDAKILGAYGTGLIDGLFGNIQIPSGWHKEYRLFAQITTGATQVRVGINNIWTNWANTWSADSFRIIASTGYFKQSDIVLEPVLNYPSQNGTNLKVQGSTLSGGTDSTSYSVTSIVVCGFLVEN